jgi:NTP pyrophosphatase (non-canonical NTP hydrolase)
MIIEESKILQAAIDNFGISQQLDLAIEECSELITAISHWRRDRCKEESILEEVADVEIMCNQIRLILDYPWDKEEDSVVDRIKKEKISRLKTRLIKNGHKFS